AERVRARPIPFRAVRDDRHAPRHVGVDAEDGVIADGVSRFAYVGEVLFQRVVMHAQFHAGETFGEPRLDFLDAIGRGLHFARRRVELDGSAFAAEQFVRRLVARFADDVPARRLDPADAPAEVAHLAHALADGEDVVGALAEKVRAEEGTEARALAPHRRGGGIAFDSVARGQPDQVEAIFRLAKARNPRRTEHRRERHGHMPEIDARDPHAPRVRRTSAAREVRSDRDVVVTPIGAAYADFASFWAAASGRAPVPCPATFAASPVPSSPRADRRPT